MLVALARTAGRATASGDEDPVAEDPDLPGAYNLGPPADSVRTVGLLSWRYTDPGSLVAERLGVPMERQS